VFKENGTLEKTGTQGTGSAIDLLPLKDGKFASGGAVKEKACRSKQEPAGRPPRENPVLTLSERKGTTAFSGHGGKKELNGGLFGDSFHQRTN